MHCAWQARCKRHVHQNQVFVFAKVILRDRCSTLYDLASLFRGKRSTLDRWNGKIAKRIGYKAAALHSTFHVFRKSRRIASFLTLSRAFACEHWRNLAEWLPFRCCQVQELRKFQGIAWFLTLSSSKIEEVSRNSLVFDFVKFKNWALQDWFVFKLAGRQADR